MDQNIPRNNEILKQLQELYPQLFSIDNPKLLKVGVYKDIRSEGKIQATAQELSRFLHYFCTRPIYAMKQELGAIRYNLLGEVAGEVTQKDLEAKSIAIASAIAKRKALKKKEDNNSPKPGN
jgi:ProP effector